MRTDILPIGLYEENIYILHDDGHILIIDPSRYPKKILSQMISGEVADGIILTHGHSDHTMAADDLADALHCDIYMNPEDFALTDPKAGRIDGTESPIYHKIKDLKSGNMKIGVFSLTIYHTPGHTAGSSCIRYKNLLFTGDTLFAGDCGRTDLYSGSEEQLIQSLHELSQLPKDLTVYPGHGPASSISQELKVNPYLH
ncbi:MAG: MBL fold metallo-hydrolase [Erysipelotrichia bacterium]|nr:MBL fold metallo-hydrolase [Erysipelotrichia bacterium]